VLRVISRPTLSYISKSLLIIKIFIKFINKV
jgi:hypothetical protein